MENKFPDAFILRKNNTIRKEKYDTCFRIRNKADDRCVAYNPSVEHWRMFYNDIFKIHNGELEFNEGKYTVDTAQIEAKKI